MDGAEARFFNVIYGRPYQGTPEDQVLMQKAMSSGGPWTGNLQGQGPIMGPQDRQAIPATVPPQGMGMPMPEPQAPMQQAPLPMDDVNARMHELEVARGHREADAEWQARQAAAMPPLQQGMVPEQGAMPMVDVTGKQVPKDTYAAMVQPQAMQTQAPAPQAPMQQAAPEQAQAPAQGNSPPANEQEFEQRRQGWTQVLGEFMKQPNAREVMMMVGLKLLQGRKPGESPGQQFGAAIGTGVTARSMQKQNALEGEDKLRKQGMEDERHQVGMRRDTAQADKAEAENDFYSKTRAEAMEEIRLGIENLKTKGQLAQAQLVEQQFQNGNLKEAWELTKQDKRSSIWARNEQVKTGRMNAEKIPAAGQAKRDIEDLVRRANPKELGETAEAYDQRIAQATLGVQGTSKTNSAADLLKLAEQTEDDTERAALLKEADALIRGRQQGPATGRGGTAKSGKPTLQEWMAKARVANPKTPEADLVKYYNSTYGK